MAYQFICNKVLFYYQDINEEVRKDFFYYEYDRYTMQISLNVFSLIANTYDIFRHITNIESTNFIFMFSDRHFFPEGIRPARQ